MSKKKVVAIVVVVLVVMSGGAVGAYLYSRTKKTDTTEEKKPISTKQTIDDHLKTVTDPRLQASIKLGQVATAMTEKNYDMVISLSEEVLLGASTPTDSKQVARRNLMYAYNLKSDKTNAKKYAEEYKQNIPSDDLDLKAKEIKFIDEQIVIIDSGKPLQTVGGSEEGE